MRTLTALVPLVSRIARAVAFTPRFDATEVTETPRKEHAVRSDVLPRATREKAERLLAEPRSIPLHRRRLHGSDGGEGRSSRDERVFVTAPSKTAPGTTRDAEA